MPFSLLSANGRLAALLLMLIANVRGIPQAAGVPVSPATTNDIPSLTYRPICEKNPHIRPQKRDCLKALKVLPNHIGSHSFHNGGLDDGYAFPVDGFEFESCVLFPHIVDYEEQDVSSWYEISQAMRAIIETCAHKEPDWGDDDTGGTIIIGERNLIYIDIRTDMRPGPHTNNTQTLGEDAVAVA